MDNRLKNLVPTCVRGNNANKGKYVRGADRERKRRDSGKYRLQCVICARTFYADKLNAKTCSDRHRKQLSRGSGR